MKLIEKVLRKTYLRVPLVGIAFGLFGGVFGLIVIPLINWPFDQPIVPFEYFWNFPLTSLLLGTFLGSEPTDWWFGETEEQKAFHQSG